MSLQKQVVSIDLLGGMDTKRKDKLVLPGKLLSITDGEVEAGGTPRKRDGFGVLSEGALVGGGTLAASDFFAIFNDEILQASKHLLYSHSDALGKLSPRGRNAFVSLRKQQILRNTSTQQNADSARSGDIALYAWEDSRGGVRYTIRDESSGALIVHDVQVSATAVMPRCLAMPHFLAIVFIDGGNLRVAYVSPGNPSVALTFSTLQVDVHATQKCHGRARASRARTSSYVAYVSTTPQLARFVFTPGGAVGARQNLAMANAVNSIAVSRTTDARLQTWWAELTVGIRCLADTVAGTVLTAFGGPNTIDATVSAGGRRRCSPRSRIRRPRISPSPCISRRSGLRTPLSARHPPPAQLSRWEPETSCATASSPAR
jgi:hypothetical protein